jgi:ribosomal protein S18 acetylase RimI-like enzyme
MELAFAPLDNGDEEVIFSLSRDLILTYEDPRDIDLDKALQWTRRKIHARKDEYRRIILDGDIAGYFRLFSREGILELDDLYILKEFRRRGLADGVVRHCIAQGKPLELYVFKENHAAMALYRKHGFTLLRTEGNTRSILRREVL